jgi:hypothetical protein
VSVILTSSIEFKSCLESNALLGSGCFCIRKFSCVESIDIGLVMLRVVESHNLLRDVGLESIVRVWEGGKSVIARHCGGFGMRCAGDETMMSCVAIFIMSREVALSIELRKSVLSASSMEQ